MRGPRRFLASLEIEAKYIGNNNFKGTTLILGTVLERNGGFSCNINFYLYYFLHLRLAVAALREQKKVQLFENKTDFRVKIIFKTCKKKVALHNF